MMSLLLVIILLCAFLLVTTLLVIGIMVALFTTKKEKKEYIRVSAEAQKIDAMASAGKITAEEARELKQALGPIAFTPTSREPDIHIKVIGILNIVFGCLGGSIGLLAPFFIFKLFNMNTGASGVIRLSVLALLPLLLILSIFILRIVSGAHLMKGAPWARIVIIIFAILGIMAFPLGTALGIYTLWTLLFRENAGLYFISDKK